MKYGLSLALITVFAIPLNTWAVQRQFKASCEFGQITLNNEWNQGEICGDDDARYQEAQKCATEQAIADCKIAGALSCTLVTRVNQGITRHFSCRASVYVSGIVVPDLNHNDKEN